MFLFCKLCTEYEYYLWKKTLLYTHKTLDDIRIVGVSKAYISSNTQFPLKTNCLNNMIDRPGEIWIFYSADKAM
jgi:hypothetical protein